MPPRVLAWEIEVIVLTLREWLDRTTKGPLRIERALAVRALADDNSGEFLDFDQISK